MKKLIKISDYYYVVDDTIKNKIGWYIGSWNLPNNNGELELQPKNN